MTNNDVVPGFDDETPEGLELSAAAVEGLKGGLLVTLAGHLDTLTSPALQKKVLRAVEAGFHRIILECSRLDFVSSTGIGTFSALVKKLRPLSGDLVILHCHPRPLATFELMGFKEYFNFVESLEEAWERFGHPSRLPKLPAFPTRVACPVCGLSQSADRAGSYRCQGCQALLDVGTEGTVFLAPG